MAPERRDEELNVDSVDDDDDNVDGASAVATSYSSFLPSTESEPIKTKNPIVLPGANWCSFDGEYHVLRMSKRPSLRIPKDISEEPTMVSSGA